MAKNIRSTMKEQTEKLAEKAVDDWKIVMGDVADAVRHHYSALPTDLLGRMQRARAKS